MRWDRDAATDQGPLPEKKEFSPSSAQGPWPCLRLDFLALEKEMATHSRVLAWKIPGMVEPGGLPSTGSHRVGRN